MGFGEIWDFFARGNYEKEFIELASYGAVLIYKPRCRI